VASFKSTLKEVLEADLIVMVLDMSSPQIKDHVDTITDVLKEMSADSIPVIHVLNKVDLISDGNMIEKLKRSFPGSVIISADKHLRLSDLTKKIMNEMESNYQTVDLEFSYDDGKTIANVQQGVEVLERAYEEEGVKLKIRGSRSRINQIMGSID
jgi:GTP-binding protein HflX